MSDQPRTETFLQKWGIIIFAAVLLAAAGIYLAIHFSSSSIESQIVGTWREANGSEEMVFFKDGTFYTVVDGQRMAGDYSFPSKESIRLEYGGIGAAVGPIVAPVSISRDVLTIGLPDDPGRYNREK